MRFRPVHRCVNPFDIPPDDARPDCPSASGSLYPTSWLAPFPRKGTEGANSGTAKSPAPAWGADKDARGLDFPPRVNPFLRPPQAGGGDQNLPHGMDMPVGAPGSKLAPPLLEPMSLLAGHRGSTRSLVKSMPKPLMKACSLF